MKSIIVLFLCLSIQFVYSQSTKKGTIEGKVVEGTVKDFLEGTTGDIIPNAKILVDGTDFRAISDFDGKYVIKNIPFGTYTLTISSPGLSTKKLEDVIVSSEEVLFVDVALEPITQTMIDVVVKVKVSKSDDVGTMTLKKNSANSSDVISAQTISKTPDKTTSDVLKRVSGASIQDNKFAIVRGLNDRYNAAYLNDGPLPSSESDRKAFSFDIFPANMLDNITIVKTATPDLPAEFAGGIIQINTKTIPSKNFQSLQIGGGYNTITTFKDQVTYKGGKYDWLGIDDGTRALSPNIPAKLDFPINSHSQALLAKETTTNWGLENKNFSPNLSLQYSAGVTTQLLKKEIGIVAALTYSKTNNFNSTIRRSYVGSGVNGTTQLEFDYLDKVYSTQILAGTMVNFTVKLNNNNKLSFKNLYSINTDDRVIARSGISSPTLDPVEIKSNVTWFTGNNIYSGQLGGEHVFKKEKFKLHWIGSYSSIKRVIPSIKRSIYSRTLNGEDTNFYANISTFSVSSDYGGGIFSSQNDEQITSLKADLIYHLTTISSVKTDIKIGAYYQDRNRDFSSRQLGYTQYKPVGNSFDNSLLTLDQNTIFSAENMGVLSSGKGGFKLSDVTKFTDAYQASSTITAGFLMIDNKIHNSIRVIWGARGEYFTQRLDALKNDKKPLVIDVKQLDILPSINTIFSVTKKQNIRLSYSKTLNRPEYRELAPFAFYDFNTQFVLSGNDSLKIARIDNVDLRYEYYPGKGQLLSLTGFYKKFINPIEMIARADVDKESTYKNVPTASNFGVELEARSIIGELINADSSSILNNFTFYSNLTVIKSIVDVSDIVGTPYESRPLQGQSPYVFNAGLTYIDEKLDLSVSANINKVGDRIAILGTVLEPDIWEKNRTFIDLQIAKTFLKRKFEIKLNFQNILSQDQIFYQNNYINSEKVSPFMKGMNTLFVGEKTNRNGYDEKLDDLLWSTNFGKTISFSLSYKF